MEQRIKEIRKLAHLTQTEFGEKIGTKGNTVTGYETGLRTPSDAVIKSICREFHVNETWLRTGEGAMFQERSRVDELTDFISTIMDDDDGFRLALITVLSRLEPEQWETLADLAERLVQEMEAQNSE